MRMFWDYQPLTPAEIRSFQGHARTSEDEIAMLRALNDLLSTYGRRNLCHLLDTRPYDLAQQSLAKHAKVSIPQKPTRITAPALLEVLATNHEHFFRNARKHLGVRILNALSWFCRAKFLCDVVVLDPLVLIAAPNFGKQALREIERLLKESGLSLGMVLDDRTREAIHQKLRILPK